MVDGKYANELEIRDGHSLDAADSDPMDALIVDNEGRVGIGTMSPQQKIHISGVMRLEPQSSQPFGALGDLYVSTDGKLYFHNGTQWREVSLP